MRSGKDGSTSTRRYDQGVFHIPLQCSIRIRVTCVTWHCSSPTVFLHPRVKIYPTSHYLCFWQIGASQDFHDERVYEPETIIATCNAVREQYLRF